MTRPDSSFAVIISGVVIIMASSASTEHKRLSSDVLASQNVSNTSSNKDDRLSLEINLDDSGRPKISVTKCFTAMRLLTVASFVSLRDIF